MPKRLRPMPRPCVAAWARDSTPVRRRQGDDRRSPPVYLPKGIRSSGETVAETEIRNLSGIHRFWRILGLVVLVGLALYELPALAGRWLFYLVSPFIFFT